MRATTERAATERRVAELECGQHGLVTVAQLSALGLSEAAIRRRVRSGRHVHVPVGRGVLANPGVPACFRQAVLAVVLAAGDTAFASHETAARLWELPLPEPPGSIEVTTVLERRPRRPGMRMHRSGHLVEVDVTFLGALPVSSPERTIVDLSSRYDLRTLGLIVDDALRRCITSLGRILSTTDRLRPAPGRSQKKMREVLARRVPGTELRESPLEDFVFDALRRFALPLPVPQHAVVVDGHRRRIDLCYVREKLAIEALGFEYHSGRARFDDDALRGNELRLAGWRMLTVTSAFTDWQIADHVARALAVPPPRQPPDPLTFEEWMSRH